MKLIKKVWFSPYTLTERQSRKNHYGILLKVLFLKGEIGYTSLHPLFSFGEGRLSDYFSLLKDCNKLDVLMKTKTLGKKTPYRGGAVCSFKIQARYLNLSLQSAWLDAQARVQGHSLLFGYSPIESYKFISNIHEALVYKSYCTFKIKMGENLELETKQLKEFIKNFSTNFRWRLDFNGRISQSQWIQWEKKNFYLLPYVDYIEDPFSPFSMVPSRFPLAGDWGLAYFCPIRVIKASRHCLTSVYEDLAGSRYHRVIFTHSLAHPLEARLSWVKANHFYKVHPRKKETCGLDYPFDFFEKNDFSCFYSPSQFYSSAGTGLGFDELLEQQKWKSLEYDFC